MAKDAELEKIQDDLVDLHARLATIVVDRDSAALYWALSLLATAIRLIHDEREPDRRLV